ncbi:MAG TPA: VIT1/CCC1 transporter family protein [Candidatus Methylomirabilis sp.]|nr:VIT1/CCC1 transporter family protein [Candidatus Methylomirabilis sp.]
MASYASGLSPSAAPSRQSFIRRHLDPTESLGEVLFGLIMAFSFTLGAGLIVKEGAEATTRMLWGILGCNVAWGFIDGAMYAMSSVFDRSRKARLLQSIQSAASEKEALAMVGRELDPRLEPFTSLEERTRLYPAVLKRLFKATPERTRVKKEDVYGAIAVFWLVFLSTIPAVVPFLLFPDRFVALRVSNLLLLIMLFWAGYRWGRATNSNPWIVGLILLLVGLAMVAVVMALGG